MNWLLKCESSLDLAGGAIRTAGGEILLRASGKADTAQQYGDIVVSAIKVANRVKGYLATIENDLPDGITVGYWRDRSRVVKARLNTLLKSAVQGSILILLLLTLFLRFWVAVWVFVGVPVSILGGIALMPLTGVTINLISLFAFILVLGIVVDDAIVTGEKCLLLLVCSQR